MNYEIEAVVETLNALQENIQSALRGVLIENQRMRYALEYYANPENMWVIPLNDGGRKAREALRKKGNYER